MDTTGHKEERVEEQIASSGRSCRNLQQRREKAVFVTSLQAQWVGQLGARSWGHDGLNAVTGPVLTALWHQCLDALSSSSIKPGG